MKTILSLKFDEAKEFFLKNESYCNIGLPPYINFEAVLEKISTELKENNYTSIKKKNPNFLEKVNHKILHNKNGKYEWRPYELIHPVLYVSLVNKITNYKNWKEIKKRFGFIRGRSVVNCISLPVVSESKQSDKAEQITNWWKQIEQKSLELSLDFSFIYHTDISNCYGSIYTHSIPWAIHSKKISKKNHSKKLVGNNIDDHIRAMSYGQTNGIPQGSILMDFIAEIVLNYADLLLSKKIQNKFKEGEYKIIRYRDDYRIFVNNPMIADTLIKELSEALMSLGLKLHANKTINFSNVIEGSIKSDKIEWLMSTRSITTVQKQLLVLHAFSQKFPCSGTLIKELQNVLKRINRKTNTNRKLKKFIERENLVVLISICTDIAYHNPNTYPLVAAVLSKLFSLIECKSDLLLIIKKVIKKISKIPHTGHMQIWLQRSILKIDDVDYSYFTEDLCKAVEGKKVELWNNDWLPKRKYVNAILNKVSVIDQAKIDNLDMVIDNNEVFLYFYLF